MRDEIGIKSKTDILDFVISFIVEHEKRIDSINKRLERITGTIGKKRHIISKQNSPVKIKNPNPGTFIISIRNPEGFDPIKSIKIEWDDNKKILQSDYREFDSILKDIEYTLRDDGRD